ncbi:MAG: carboxypeptidase-like regulatory domain-containing protein [Pirellulales bacterium]
MPVTGRVMLDGQPVPMAEVQFQPEDNGSPSYAVADNDGRYELGYKRGVKGAMVGWHTIRIESATIVEGPNGKITNRPQIVPPRYNDSSELRREVRSDEDNVFDFELTSNAE